ncbi:DsbA family protein [Sulfitobacter sp. D35]|uniref:DsbA family protein n=1 Tax=Sulfitobacter sp. D35 TaxID=3083252 RepID=UPI00296EDF98|nr:DsbA family protein [Sulfitobacter sp. D35]MDW4498322.1 DsbA family protein [Sulfitobacter sp. D35]
MSRLTALLAAIAVLGLGTFIYGGGAGQTGATSLPFAANAQEAEVDTSTVTEMTQGNPDAPVTVIEYASFTCPHCASFHAGAYKQLKTDYIDTGKINFVYREVFFDRFGLWASMIARCADKPETFFGIADLVYAGQSEWVRAGEPAQIVEELRKIGRLAGLDGDTMEACLQDGDKARTLVAWYEENAAEHGIDSTPSFVINGKKYGNMPYDEMAQIIDEAAE